MTTAHHRHDGQHRPHDRRKQALMLKRITSWSSSSFGVDFDAQYTVFGASGALVTAATSILPIELTRRQHQELQ